MDPPGDLSSKTGFLYALGVACPSFPLIYMAGIDSFCKKGAFYMTTIGQKVMLEIAMLGGNIYVIFVVGEVMHG